MHALPACPSSRCRGNNNFLATWVFSAPLSVLDVLYEGHRAKITVGVCRTSLHPVGRPDRPSAQGGKNICLCQTGGVSPSARFLLTMQMEELLEGELAQPGEGLTFPSKLKYLFSWQRGWGTISREFSLYLWFYLFILEDLVRPKPLAPAKPSRGVPLSHTRA